MSVIFVLILASLVVAILFLGLFIWAVRSGQYDDDYTPSIRMLFDNEDIESQTKSNQKTNHIQ
jgi:cbb3-type cytochrome oxidase maturation protein